MRFLGRGGAIAALFYGQLAVANKWTDTNEGEYSYVTRPDLKPQALVIKTFEPDLVTPGYFFIAPYDHKLQTPEHRSYIPGQIGPHIYDANGDLVWSGAYQFGQRIVHNLEVATYNGEEVLTFSLFKEGQAEDVNAQFSTGIVIDQHYEIKHQITASNGTRGLNMHEFNLVDDGKHGLVVVVKKEKVTQTGPPPENKEYVDKDMVIYGFEDIDMATENTTFQWWAIDHIPIKDTYMMVLGDIDPFHINSVDKTSDGNYLISVRHMSALYLIDGTDGHIIWQLGGRSSDFEHVDDFEFSYQHHARLYSHNETHTVVTFLDNASSQDATNEDCTSGVIISLSTSETPMTATLLNRWKRPDNKYSRLRGSVQMLPNDNAFIQWSDFGYTTEFTWEGKEVQQVRWISERFDDYRAFKFNFTGYSNEPIALVSHVHGTSAKSLTTTMYVSWNGATTVATWNFYSVKSTEKTDDPVLIGSQNRTGFETVLMVPGYFEHVYAEAVDEVGKVLNTSDVQSSEPPAHFRGVQREELMSWPKSHHAPADPDGDPIPEAAEAGLPALLWVGVATFVAGVASIVFAIWLVKRDRNSRGLFSRLPVEPVDDEKPVFVQTQDDGGGDADDSLLSESEHE